MKEEEERRKGEARIKGYERCLHGIRMHGRKDYSSARRNRAISGATGNRPSSGAAIRNRRNKRRGRLAATVADATNQSR